MDGTFPRGLPDEILDPDDTERIVVRYRDRIMDMDGNKVAEELAALRKLVTPPTYADLQAENARLRLERDELVNFLRGIGRNMPQSEPDPLAPPATHNAAAWSGWIAGQQIAQKLLKYDKD